MLVKKTYFMAKHFENVVQMQIRIATMVANLLKGDGHEEVFFVIIVDFSHPSARQVLYDFHVKTFIFRL